MLNKIGCNNGILILENFHLFSIIKHFIRINAGYDASQIAAYQQWYSFKNLFYYSISDYHSF
jgi:hypothetical protein